MCVKYMVQGRGKEVTFRIGVCERETVFVFMKKEQ